MQRNKIQLNEFPIPKTPENVNTTSLENQIDKETLILKENKISDSTNNNPKIKQKNNEPPSSLQIQFISKVNLFRWIRPI